MGVVYLSDGVKRVQKALWVVETVLKDEAFFSEGSVGHLQREVGEECSSAVSRQA
jgi:hypothetical protein